MRDLPLRGRFSLGAWRMGKAFRHRRRRRRRRRPRLLLSRQFPQKVILKT